MSASLKVNSQIRDCIPQLRTEEYEGLEEDIKKRGCLGPVIAWKEKKFILDGHNRFTICRNNNIKYNIKWISFPDIDEAIIWVMGNSLHRRNLSDFQRGDIGLQRGNKLEELARRRMLGGKSVVESEPSAKFGPGYDVEKTQEKPGTVLSQIAEETGISRGSLQKIGQVKESAVDPILEMATTGEISIDAAHKISTLPKSEQRAIAKEGAAAVKAAAAEIRKSGPRKKREPKDIKDKKGMIIAIGDVAEVFERREEITAAMDAIAKLKTSVLARHKKGDPLYSKLNETLFQSSMDEAHQALRFTMPYVVCRACNGDGGLKRSCRNCRGSGWLNEMGYRALPESERK